jgi:hypothetical protein
MDPLLGFLFWSAVINLGLLVISFLAFTLGGNFMYRIFGKWYDISREQCNTIVFSGMMFYKICILFFNIVPYVVLRILW